MIEMPDETQIEITDETQIETTYDLYEHAGSDGVSDHLFDLVRAGDSRLAGLQKLGPQ